MSSNLAYGDVIEMYIVKYVSVESVIHQHNHFLAVPRFLVTHYARTEWVCISSATSFTSRGSAQEVSKRKCGDNVV